METRLLGISLQIMALAVVISVVLLILGMGVLVLIRASTVGVFSWGDSGRRDSDPGNAGSNGLSPDDLEKLPCYDYAVKDSKEDSSVECAVCLETFRDSQRCRLLPACKHSFHVECVDSWLLKASICPLCRTICAEQSGSGPG
ncbi:RING-H2 finger protein ATL56-like [Iris pallida]|uniref:RING-H2 finger protein ATL56-like n=1 Tax=Iris pallida TaxID=29817 RepID=A0AAX6ENA3_IRIPA|nr:RING-H2 finger protein ATL56-like [Iris pallida]KAJ6817749.1 RING-H2 finger protein ATL56-like [Iris pallida]KAJ6830127.1 RING-H2 finger protein ATL56-like [Iris pallida]KAJ6833781.1 RING-H2 finger protein ATL56-like [Iris pallida]